MHDLYAGKESRRDLSRNSSLRSFNSHRQCPAVGETENCDDSGQASDATNAARNDGIARVVLATAKTAIRLRCVKSLPE